MRGGDWLGTAGAALMVFAGVRLPGAHLRHLGVSLPLLTGV